jgi:hypothetical protein
MAKRKPEVLISLLPHPPLLNLTSLFLLISIRLHTHSQTLQDFFKEFGPVFEREARFSKKEPVPMLGAIDATKDEVEGFYNFWYNFDSWRSFEYMDKEVNEGSDKYVRINS